MSGSDKIIVEVDGRRTEISREQMLRDRAAAAGGDESSVAAAQLSDPVFVSPTDNEVPVGVQQNAMQQLPASDQIVSKQSDYYLESQFQQQPNLQPQFQQQPNLQPQFQQQPNLQPQFQQPPALTTVSVFQPQDADTEPKYKIICQPDGAMITTEAYVHRIIRNNDTLVLVWDMRSKYPKCLPSVRGEIALHVDGSGVVYLLESNEINFPFDNWQIYVYQIKNEYPYGSEIE